MNTYEKKYKEAQKWIESIYPNLSHEQQMEAEAFFPELKESEDERIRKALIELVHDTTGDSLWVDYNVHKEDALAWLEKQGKQNTNHKTMIVKFICKKDWHGIGDYYYGKIYNGYPCEKEQKGYDIYDDNNIPTFCDEDFIDEYFNIITEEKQGEQKPIFDFKAKDWYVSKVDGKIHNIYHSVDKVEPKFKVGDYVVGKYISGYISEVGDDCYLLDYQGFSIDKQDNYHLWTIQDAKDGDVLAERLSSGRTIVIIYNGLNEEDTILSHCGYNGSDFVVPKNGIGFGHLEFNLYTPATKEQRDLLFQKMKEAGYEWDADKKELKKISQRMVSAEVKEAMYDKPTWSEEDENVLEDIKEAIINYWGGETQDILLDWLKSLKERCTWKPNLAQLNALSIVSKGNATDDIEAIVSLYNDLKKL